MAVSTTRTVKRGFERERKVENIRRKEVGCAAAAVVRIEEASGGRGTSSGLAAASCCCFRASLRRWGGRFSSDCDSGGDCDVEVEEGDVMAAVDVARVFLATMRNSRQLDLSNMRLDAKKGAPERDANVEARAIPIIADAAYEGTCCGLRASCHCSPAARVRTLDDRM
jgi:hypothetical protein